MRRLFVFVLAAVLLMGLAVPGHAGKSKLTLTAPACVELGKATVTASSSWAKDKYVVVHLFSPDGQQASNLDHGKGTVSVTVTAPFTTTTSGDWYAHVFLYVMRQGQLKLVESQPTATTYCVGAG